MRRHRLSVSVGFYPDAAPLRLALACRNAGLGYDPLHSNSWRLSYSLVEGGIRRTMALNACPPREKPDRERPQSKAQACPSAGTFRWLFPPRLGSLRRPVPR